MLEVCILSPAHVVVDHTLLTQLQRSAKLKISQILLISVFGLSSLHLLSKSILSNRFAKLLLSRNHLMICSSSVVNSIAVAALLLMSFLHCC